MSVNFGINDENIIVEDLDATQPMIETSPLHSTPVRRVASWTNISPDVDLTQSSPEERFLEVKDQGYWFIEFYAPWCGHCKRLHSIWEQVGHNLAETEIRVGRVDCTRFTSVSSAMGVHGFPTIKFFRHGVEYTYEGDRTREAILDFALKTVGPEIRPIEGSTSKSFQEIHNKHARDAYFVFVSQPFNADNEDSQLKTEYSAMAKGLFTKAYLYEAEKAILTENITVSNTPAIICIKDGAVYEYEQTEAQTLNQWVESERWIAFPEITYASLYDMGLCCNKLLVMATLELAYKSKKNHPVSNFWKLAEKTAKGTGRKLHKHFQFGWSNGNEIASSITLGAMPIPGLLVINVSSYQFYIPDDPAEKMTEASIMVFLESIIQGEKTPQGGRGVIQRIKRIFYEFFTAIYTMFATQPLLTSCLFGLPIGILSVICYSLCSADFSVEQEDVYPESEESEDDDHEKLE